MKKTILTLGVIVMLASCGGIATVETPKKDSTAVVLKTDTIVTKKVADSAKVDTTKKVK